MHNGSLLTKQKPKRCVLYFLFCWICFNLDASTVFLALYSGLLSCWKLNLCRAAMDSLSFPFRGFGLKGAEYKCTLSTPHLKLNKPQWNNNVSLFLSICPLQKLRLARLQIPGGCKPFQPSHTNMEAYFRPGPPAHEHMGTKAAAEHNHHWNLVYLCQTGKHFKPSFWHHTLQRLWRQKLIDVYWFSLYENNLWLLCLVKFLPDTMGSWDRWRQKQCSDPCLQSGPRKAACEIHSNKLDCFVMLFCAASHDSWAFTGFQDGHKEAWISPSVMCTHVGSYILP